MAKCMSCEKSEDIESSGECEGKEQLCKQKKNVAEQAKIL